eukprot:1082505-Pleurochrysis_carterae.AAC.1
MFECSSGCVGVLVCRAAGSCRSVTGLRGLQLAIDPSRLVQPTLVGRSELSWQSPRRCRRAETI